MTITIDEFCQFLDFSEEDIYDVSILKWRLEESPLDKNKIYPVSYDFGYKLSPDEETKLAAIELIRALSHRVDASIGWRYCDLLPEFENVVTTVTIDDNHCFLVSWARDNKDFRLTFVLYHMSL